MCSWLFYSSFLGPVMLRMLSRHRQWVKRGLALHEHTVTQLTTRFRTMPKMCLISVGVQVAFPSRSREDVHVISNKNFWRTLLYRKSISLLGYSPNFLLFTGKRALCVSQNICNKGLSESKIELEYTKILDPIRYKIFWRTLWYRKKILPKGFF